MNLDVYCDEYNCKFCPMYEVCHTEEESLEKLESENEEYDKIKRRWFKI